VAAVCEVCGKHPSFGMNLSHSHRRTKRRWDPNIQRVRALVNGSPRRLHVCTSCIRAGKVTKPPRRTSPSPHKGSARSAEEHGSPTR
jgi:large subunit ribosomal protein L28